MEDNPTIVHQMGIQCLYLLSTFIPIIAVHFDVSVIVGITQRPQWDREWSEGGI